MEVLYFYDERDGKGWSGWYVATELAGMSYACFRPGPADLPDERGWIKTMGTDDALAFKLEVSGGATHLIEAVLPQDSPRCLPNLLYFQYDSS